MPEWIRLTCEPDDEDEFRYAELLCEGNKLYIRCGRADGKETVEIKTLKTEESARRSLTTRINALRREGYLSDDPVDRPLPDASTADENRRRRQ